MARKLEVEFVGDTRNLDRSFNKAGRGAEKFGKQVTLMGRLTSKGGAGFGLFTRGATAATAALVGGAGLIVAVKKVSEAFGEAEASQARLKAQLKAGGISYKAHAKQIDQVIQRISKLAALDDEDLQDSFTNIVRTTGSVSKSLKLTGLAADFARGKHIDVAKAGEIVAKVAGGNTGILSRYGITIEKGATATEALAALQKKFAGQAEEYGKTSAAASDRFSVAVENLQEWLGGQLAPTFKTVKNAVAEFVQGIATGTGAGGRFRDRMTEAFAKVKSVVLSLVPTVVTAFGTVKSTLAGIVDTIRTLVTNFKDGKAGAVAIVAGLAAIGGAAVAIYAVSTAMRVAAVATTVWAAAQALLNAALTANPIGLVIVGLAALAAGLTIAYTKSETFRNIVNGAFTAVKTAAATVFPVVKKMAELGLLGPVGLAITRWSELKAFLVNAWNVIKGAAGVWVAIGKLITTPIRAAVTLVMDLIGGKGLTKSLSNAWNVIKGGVSDFASGMKSAIVTAFQGAVGLVTGFVNKIIDVVNLIPGVDIKKIGGGGGAPSIPRRTGQENLGGTGHLARGGAFGLTGGTVNAPMVMMGEEAPRHPEFVIPTNPAYRGRAQMLLGQAADAVGYRKGGILGGGLDLLSKGGSAALNLITKGPGALIDKLPGSGSLPDWLQGLGGFAVSKAGDFIKDKISGVLRSIFGDDAPPPGAGAGAMAAMISYGQSMASRGLPYVYGGGHGAFGPPFDCSGFVSAILHSAGLLGAPVTTDGLKVYGESGDGKYVTIGVRGSSGRSAHTMIKVGKHYFESGGGGNGAHARSGWNGAFPIHRHPPGLARGGMLTDQLLDPRSDEFVGWGLRTGGTIPFAGAYKNGGIVPRTGLALVHKGETVIPGLAKGAKLTGSTSASHGSSVKSTAYPPQWVYDELAADAAHRAEALAVVDTGGGSDEGGGLQDSIDDLNATITDLNDQLEKSRQRYENVEALYRTSQSQYDILSAAIADVANRGIGGRVGLGFMSPSFAGGGVRY